MLDVIQSHSHPDPSQLPMDSFGFTNNGGSTNQPSNTGSDSPTTKTEDGLSDIPFASFDDDLDHRKRRRNRTTQSCWSCHQAKRKCDRKRPCSRCIQLGLTGLCVYETDDPASRDDPSLTESQRLRKRIAELEALVREMKNKPHPRWADKVQSGNIGVDKWHTRAKYVVGANGGEYDEYGYRFPPMNIDGVDPTTGSLPPPFDENARRLSIASSSVSSSSSPRTPYLYHTGGGGGTHTSGCGLSSNPCTCLSSSSSTARALANAIRNVVLESGVGHPYAEGCKVLALVRELEGEASPTTSSSSGPSTHSSNYFSNPNPSSQSNPNDPHSNSGSPVPHSSTNSAGSSPMNLPHTSLPLPLPLPHSLITPPTPTNQHNSRSSTMSYYPSLSYPSSYHHHHQSQGDIRPPTVPSMAHSHSHLGTYGGSSHDFGVEYSSSTNKYSLGVV